MSLYFSSLFYKIKKIPNNLWFLRITWDATWKCTLKILRYCTNILYNNEILLVSTTGFISQIVFKYSTGNVLHLFQWTVITKMYFRSLLLKSLQGLIMILMRLLTLLDHKLLLLKLIININSQNLRHSH